MPVFNRPSYRLTINHGWRFILFDDLISQLTRQAIYFPIPHGPKLETRDDPRDLQSRNTRGCANRHLYPYILPERTCTPAGLPIKRNFEYMCISPIKVHKEKFRMAVRRPVIKYFQMTDE
ncbi:hypothetical protein BC937DRAFT_88575 [Endogone sp. FLAS-F59071]|nr:hypothetical protein BC937DRAFT_88575 [Endogone sp. FLAS-F59071]|eukprot:RUS22544.1 hypothetical protein BC937DRAFT_88575 [Endogone sp. FLAS-F59071]